MTQKTVAAVAAPPPGDVPGASGAEPASTGLIRTILVKAVEHSGEAGLTREAAERAVAAELGPRLTDPIESDIDSLIKLGVLAVEKDRLRTTSLAQRYLKGAAVLDG